jgi:hypothetical protein
VPQVVPFDEQGDLRRRLAAWTEVTVHPSFTSYYLRDGAALAAHLRQLETGVTLPDGTPVALPISFSGRLSFLGYEWLQRPPAVEGSLSLLTYWRVQLPPATRIKVFAHLLGEADSGPAPIIAQDDGLGSPPQGWMDGDLLVQKHVLSLPPDLPLPQPGLDQFSMEVGVYYDSDGGERLSALTGDRLLLYSLGEQE